MRYLSLLSFYMLVNLTITVTSRLTHDTLSSRVVTTNSGKLRGVRVDFDDESLQPVEAYLGIQYASLRDGALRFMPPTNPTEKWEGVKIANTFRPVCPQRKLDFDALSAEMPAARVDRLKRIAEYTESQSEECLYLNIYVPARDRKGPAPVVLFIHGDSYEYGTGNAYDGSVLSAYADITVVTINYRLGPLGFLSTADNSASGNYALFDLVAAVHWIQTNIADFGGDSSQVTVMGHGYGAALANMLSLAPITKRMNLFNRIILQSGSALSSWAMASNPARTTINLADSLNCLPKPVEGEPVNTADVVECLSKVDYNTIMNANILRSQFVTSYGPVVDKILLESTPEQMMKGGNTLFSHIELMFGVSKYEGSSLLPQTDLVNGITPRKRARLLRQYVRSVYLYQKQKILDILDHHYSDRDTKNNSMELKHKVIELLGDGMYNVPSILSGRYHLEMGKDTYFYVFSHSSRAMEYPHYQGGHHGEDLPFLFGAPLADKISPFADAVYTKSEKVLSEASIRFFGNFIKSGNPNIPLTDGLPSDSSADSLRFMNVYWPRYEKETQKYIQLGTRPLVNHHYRKERVALWTDLIPKLHQKDKDGSDSNDDFFDDLENSTRGFDVRHVFPQPPTPPMIPPHRPDTSTVMTTKSEGIQSDMDIIARQPITEVVTRVVEVIRYHNKTVLVTETRPLQIPSQQGVKMSLTLSVTIGVGSAFLFLNLVILIGICCQRSRLKAERDALKKTRQTSPPANSTLLPLEAGNATDKVVQGEAVKMLENHLYEKAMEQFTKQTTIERKMSSNSRTPKDVSELERGESKPLTRNPNNDNSSMSSRAKYHYDIDSESTDTEVIKGVPQGPAKGPAKGPTIMDPDIYSVEFDLCGGQYRPGSSQNTREGSVRSSQHSLSSPRPGSREPPIPRQRTSESLSRISDQEERPDFRHNNLLPQRTTQRQRSADEAYDSRHAHMSSRHTHMNGNHSYDSQSYRKMSHNGVSHRSSSDNGYHTDRSPRSQHSPRPIEESHYKTPRRLHYSSEDGGPSDSGVQHKTLNYSHHSMS